MHCHTKNRTSSNRKFANLHHAGFDFLFVEGMLLLKTDNQESVHPPQRQMVH